MFQFKDRNELANEILTPLETREFLNITRQRLLKLIREQRITPLKKVGGVTLFLKDDVHKLADSLEYKHLPKRYRTEEKMLHTETTQKTSSNKKEPN